MAKGNPLITRCGSRELRWGERTYVMGVINMTPDSFSGDGLAADPERALAQAVSFQAYGADLLDVGGESTRPGATPVSEDEELRRVLPAIRRVAELLNIPVSVDTSRLTVASQAIAAGASMINDVWGLKHDPRLAELAAETGAPLVVMHNQHGTAYRDLVPDILDSLNWSIGEARTRGVLPENIIVDPGIGFGKTAQQNLEVLRRLEEFKALGQPLLVGTSRKSTIGLVLDLPVGERLEGTAATVAIAIAKGAEMVRVHDVKEMVRVVRMSDAIVRGWKPPG